MEMNNSNINYEDYIGREVMGFKFEETEKSGYNPIMDDYIGKVGRIETYYKEDGVFSVHFEDDYWRYPANLVIKQLEQKEDLVEMMEKDEEAGIYGEPEDGNDSEPNFKKITDSLASLLEYKNKNYGNSALEPLQIFGGKCKVGTRLDDKLARVQNSNELRLNDIADCIGYMILVCAEKGWDNFDHLKD